ncbi:hypothetical protein [Anaerosporobacter faecicola]|uniref:hypothetical protein n=1 Tax=Anaerosporobacter faecicola TaxID=2718714 RepID=UPI00143938B1|nr:hypothetical protein [Anaerosporobacter faecicola]
MKNQKVKESFQKEYRCLNPNCMHIDEKGCAVVEAYQTGTITLKEVERHRKDRRTKLFQDNKAEYKKTKEGFKRGVSKNFRNKSKILKFENDQLEEQTKLAYESEKDHE